MNGNNSKFCKSSILQDTKVYLRILLKFDRNPMNSRSGCVQVKQLHATLIHITT